MTGTTRRGAACFVMGVVLTLAVGARAETAPGTDEKEARRLFQRAELSFNLGKFPEALADYQSAYQAKPLPGFLFNIAQCYRNMGDKERARFFFRRYLALDPHSPNRRKVEELIAELTKQLDAEQPVPAPATPPPAEPPPAEEAPPAAAAPPSAPPPAPAPVAPQRPSALLDSEPPPPPAARPVWRRWWFWAGAGAVVAGGVTAAVLLSTRDTSAPGTLQPIDGR